MSRGRGQGKTIALAAIGVAVAAGLGWILVRELRGGATATAVAVRDAGLATVAGAVDATPSWTPPRGVPPIRQAPDSPDRALPYRPAKYLRYSEGMPSKNAGDDDASPVLERILALTKPDGDQEATIRAAWRAHEDGRRELLAKAHPPSIGDPVLDPQELAEIDRAFDETLQVTLRHEQLARLVLEMPPPEPEPEPPAP